jgi:hypothetical protein
MTVWAAAGIAARKTEILAGNPCTPEILMMPYIESGTIKSLAIVPSKSLMYDSLP